MKIEPDIKLTGAPNEKYEKFFEKLKQIDTLDVSMWSAPHILGYFCKKYKEQYNLDYKFKFNSPSPSKCFEIFQVKKLSMLLTSNPALLKDYIDWIYINKVVKAKRRLTSISFMTAEDVIQEYKMNVLFSDNKNINRSTLLPEKYKAVFQKVNFTVNTYGDLAFISQMDPMPLELTGAISEIKALGFNAEILTRIV